MQVVDLRQTRDLGSPQKHTVGTKNEFIKRLKKVRDWYIERDAKLPANKKLLQNTFLLNKKIMEDQSCGVLFEGSQAVGLHPWLGRIPDTTSSDTTVYGITAGTKIWTESDVKEKIGVFKITYMSSVGFARMPTMIDLPREAVESTKGMSDDQIYALWVRVEAQERGTSTGRYRDICYLDLEFMRYNIKVGGIEELAGTHLDIARANHPIKICTHYVNKKGEKIPYQPGVMYYQEMIPQYIEMPGWDGTKVRDAKTFKDLPKNAQKFLKYVEKNVGVPITAVTTGPHRKHLLEL
jgi:adenylosuccinate synthase